MTFAQCSYKLVQFWQMRGIKEVVIERTKCETKTLFTLTVFLIISPNVWVMCFSSAQIFSFPTNRWTFSVFWVSYELWLNCWPNICRQKPIFSSKHHHLPSLINTQECSIKHYKSLINTPECSIKHHHSSVDTYIHK